MTLREIIAKEICERGAIPFSRYMELCLYHPELGYYSRHAEQFGKAGDFYTSSDVHAVFGRLLARQFEEMWRLLGSPERIQILELGPGRGLFAQDVLDWSEKKFSKFFRALHYSLMERSPALRGKIKETLARFLESGRASLISGDESGLEGIAFKPDVPVVIFANEFFDALPVEILSTQGALRVSVDDGRFTETWVAPSAEEMEFLDRCGIQPQTGERIEVPLAASRYLSQLAALLKTGFILAIDYGYTRQEQLAGRHRGTLMTYRQHSATTNPYQAPGEQDITTHTNFTSLAASAENSGMWAQPLVTQSQFLMGIGEPNQFADVFEECGAPQERAKVALQLKHLVTPGGMGESFRVLLASKSIDPELVAGLSGLSFARSRL